MEWYAFAGNPNSVILIQWDLIGDGSYCENLLMNLIIYAKVILAIKILQKILTLDKASFVGNSSFHNESSGNYGYRISGFEYI
jgi:hypothetical protein